MPQIVSRYGFAAKLLVLILLLGPAIAIPIAMKEQVVAYTESGADSFTSDERNGPEAEHDKRNDCPDELEVNASSRSSNLGSDETDPCPDESYSESDQAINLASDDPCDESETSPDDEEEGGGDGGGGGGGGGGPSESMGIPGLAPVQNLWREPITPMAAAEKSNPIRPFTLDSPTVEASSGEMMWREIDMYLPSVGPDFVLSRAFYSGLKTYKGNFGNGWESSLKNHIRVYSEDQGKPETIVVASGAGPASMLRNAFDEGGYTWFKSKTGKVFYRYHTVGSVKHFTRYERTGIQRHYEELDAGEGIYYLTETVDQFGNALTYSYLDASDASFNGVSFATEKVLVSIEDPEGRHIEIEWDSSDPLIDRVVAYENATSTVPLLEVDYSYVDPGAGSRHLDSVAGAKVWTEDQNGNGVWSALVKKYEYLSRWDGTLLSRVLDGDSEPLIKWEYILNSFRVHKITRGGDTALGVMTYDYDQVDSEPNEFTRYTSPTGQVRKFYVDSSGRIVKRRELLGGSAFRDTDFEYDNCDCGRVKKVTFPDGIVEEYFYSPEGRLISVWTGSQPTSGGAVNWRVERFEWSNFYPPTGDYFLRMTAKDAVRNADDTALPGDQCSDPACGGHDSASGHLRYEFNYDWTNGSLTSVDYGDIQVATSPPAYESRSETFTWFPNGVLQTREEFLDGVAIARTSNVLDLASRLVVQKTYTDLLNLDSWTTNYSHDVLGRVELYTAPNGTVTKHVLDDRHQVTFVYDDFTVSGSGRTTEARWNSRGMLWKRFIRDDATSEAFNLRYTYDNAGQTTLIERSGEANPLALSPSLPFEKYREYVYDEEGYVLEAHVWNGQSQSVGPAVFKYEYDQANTGSLRLLRRVTRNWGSTLSETVWEAGDGASTTDTLSAYDEAGRLVAWRDSIGLKHYRTYDTFGRLRRSYTEVGESSSTAGSANYSVREQKYNARGYVREVEVGGIIGEPASATSIWWDQHRKYKVNNEGDLLYFEVYEGLGTLWSVMPGRREEFTIDGWGQLLRSEVYHGKMDSTGSQVQIAVAEFEYDALGRTLQQRSIADASIGGNVEVNDFYYDDAFSQVTSISTVTGSGGYSTKWLTKYDALGRPIEDTQFEWDESTSSYGASRTWKSEYDYLNRSTASEDPAGVRNERGFDARGRLTWEKRVSSDGLSSHLTDYQYSTSNGTLSSVIDAEGVTTSFTVYEDQFNRPKRTTYGDGRWEEVSEYDAYGRVRKFKDSRTDLEHTYTYSYGRLTQDDAVWGSNPNIVGPARIAYEYDFEGKTATSRVYSESGGAYTEDWSTVRSYNWAGQLDSETQGSGADASQWSFEHGYAGELRKVVYPSGLGIKKGVYSYLDDGRTLGAEYSNASSVIANYGFSYNGFRMQERLDSVSDIRVQTGYDGWGHLTEAEWAYDDGTTWQTLDGQSRAFDIASRVIARKRSVDSTGEVFEHDKFGRLEDWYQGVASPLSHTPGSAPSSWTQLESYDLNKVYGRTQVTKQTSGQSATTESYLSTSGAHFYDSVPDGQGGQVGRTQYHGYLSDDSEFKYRYDAWGQLAEVERKSDNVIVRTHVYDASGRRVRTTDDSGLSTRFLYWGSRLAAQYDEGTSPANIKTYGYAGGRDSEAFVVVEGAGAANGSYELQRDFQGSILSLTDRATGSVVERYRYSAFGEVAIEDANGSALSSSAYANSRFFMGRPLDELTGLYDVRARWYDPSLGVFISPDPWGAVDSWNMYQYGYGTPGTWLDPFGLSSQEPGGDPIKDAQATVDSFDQLEALGLRDAYGGHAEEAAAREVLENAAEAESGEGGGSALGSFATMLPVLGELNDIGILITGYSYLECRPVSRRAGVIGLLTPGVVKGLGKAGKAVSKALKKGDSVSDGALKNASDLIEGDPSNVTKSTNKGGTRITTHYEKSGGVDQLNKDIDSLDGTVKSGTPEGLTIKDLKDGSTAVAREKSTEGRPTLEIQHTNGNKTKFRYSD